MYVPPGTLDETVDQLRRVPQSGREGLLLLIGGQDQPDLQALVSALNQIGIPFLGGVFPGVIHGHRRHATGIVAQPLPFLEPPFVARGLSTAEPDVPLAWSGYVEAEGPRTAIVLVDAMSSNISGFLARLFSFFGDSLHYFGGGAGWLDFEQRPCLIAPSGVVQDAAVLAMVPWESRLGVSHGWQRLDGPFVATRTEGNVIHELNWEPAFDIYRAAVASHTDVPLLEDDFFTVARGFPFGIPRDGAEDVVRDLVSVSADGALRCVAEVPENAVLHLLRGDRASLLKAAEWAAQTVRDASAKTPQATLLADCVSRVLFLEDAFDAELAALSRGMGEGAPDLHGMLSLGEISSHGDGLLEFFNKTIVAGALSA